MPLSDKQEKFCWEYATTLNGTIAATRAYGEGKIKYKRESAAKQACTLMKNPLVLERIAEIKAAVAIEVGITAEYVLVSLKKVADRCMGEAVIDKNGNKTGVWKFDSSGALKALEMLGRHVGIFELDNKQKAESLAEFLKGVD